MITVLHLNRAVLSTETIFDLVFRDSARIAVDLYNKKLYNAVAIVRSNHLLDALNLTKNVKGKSVRNWVRNGGFVWVEEETPMRSTSIGDILVGDERGHFLLTKFGFHYIDIIGPGTYVNNN